MPLTRVVINAPGPIGQDAEKDDEDDGYVYGFDADARRRIRDLLAEGTESFLFIFDDDNMTHDDEFRCLATPFIGHAQECNGGYWYVTFGRDDWWGVFDEGVPKVKTGDPETIDYLLERVERMIAEPIEDEYRRLAQSGKDECAILAELRTKDIRLTIDGATARFFRDVITGRPLNWRVFVSRNDDYQNGSDSSPPSYSRLARHLEPCATQ